MGDNSSHQGHAELVSPSTRICRAIAVAIVLSCVTVVVTVEWQVARLRDHEVIKELPNDGYLRGACELIPRFRYVGLLTSFSILAGAMGAIGGLLWRRSLVLKTVAVGCVLCVPILVAYHQQKELEVMWDQMPALIEETREVLNRT